MCQGGRFADMVALKGDKEIGDKMNKIISKLAETNDLKGVIDVADFNDADKLGKGKLHLEKLRRTPRKGTKSDARKGPFAPWPALCGRKKRHPGSGLRADCQRVTVEKATVRESFGRYPATIAIRFPKSRLKTIKIKAENGRFQRVHGPTHEEFSPSNRDHVLGALTQRGILVENTRKPP